MINRWLVLFAILSIAFTARAVRIAYPGDFYFDEVYHGFTATQYAKGGQAAHDAYDPWAKCPPGLAFEWTHPPLAKLIMGFFVHVFGEKSWAWRIGSVISGTGAIALTALIGFELFSPTVGLLAAALLSLDGLLLAQSRLAMNDSYFLFFALLSILFYIYAVRSKQNWNRAWVVCGISLGLALACKWTALYLIAILGIDHWYTTLIRQKKRLSQVATTTFGLGILIIGMYLASYIHFFLQGFSWKQFIELEKQMWWYHSQLTSTHPYSSKPWQWIFNLKPVWMYVDWSRTGRVSHIFNYGNSIILITGFFVAGYTLFREKTKSWATRFCLLCYFGLWVPWTFSPRIMLFYHYTPALPFLALLLSRNLVAHWHAPATWKRGLARAVPVLAIIWFLTFLPINVGISIPSGVAESFYKHIVPGYP